LRDWQEAGDWVRLQVLLLTKLRMADRFDFSRVIVDSSSVEAVAAGQKQVRAPRIARAQVPSTALPPMPMECREQDCILYLGQIRLQFMRQSGGSFRCKITLTALRANDAY